MRLVADELPRAFFVIAGGTEEQVRDYRAQAERLGLADTCLFTGRIPQAAAARLIDKATLLISPRTEGTNTPLKVYQQLASNIPVVATNIHSHTQVLDPEVAFLADPEPPAFAAAIVAALRDGDEARRRAANAKQLYANKYSRKSYKEKMCRLLAHLNTDVRNRRTSLLL